METTSDWLYCLICRYLVTHLMGADLNNIVKCQKLTDDHVQFLIYQILRGLKVSEAPSVTQESSSALAPYSLLISGVQSFVRILKILILFIYLSE